METEMKKEMTIEERALSYLAKKGLSHTDMTEVIKRGFAEIFYADTDGVAMRETKSGVQYLSAESTEAGIRLMKALEPEHSVIIHQEELADIAVKELRLGGYNQCYELAYLKEEKYPLEFNGVEIRKLSFEWVDTVNRIYHLIDNEAYIRALIEEGVMYGAFVEGELAGFIGIHTEGCMGLLEIVPKFRRRGLGELLEGYMINWNLEKGFLPFCEVFTDNEASLRLQKKLGMTMADGCIWWVYEK